MTLALGVPALLAAPAHAEEPRTTWDERLEFLEERIGAERKHAEIWWGSWLTFYTAGAIVQGARASDAEEPAQQADLWISTVKATGGALKYLFDPMNGIEGLEPRPRRPLTLSEKRKRVRRAERILEHNAEETEAFGAWYAHVFNIGINLAGGAIVAFGFDDPHTGIMSAGIGITVGEVSLFTQPWEADDDLAEYRYRFGGRTAKLPPVHWRVVPAGTGAALEARF